MMVSGGIGTLVQTALVGPIVAKVGERGAALIGAGAAAAGYACFGAASAGWAYLLAIPIFAVHNVFMPAIQGLLTERVHQGEQARLQGVVQAAQGIASIGGPLLFGLLFAWSTYGGAAQYLAGCAFFVASGLMLLVFALVPRGV